jgi:hypothetical protein
MKKTVLFSIFLAGMLVSGNSQDPYISIESQVALGSELIDNAFKAVIDSEGNRIVYGSFSEEIDFDPTATEFIIEPLGSPDLFLASYSPDGSLIWAFNLGRIALNSGMSARGLRVDSDNNVIISGGFSLTVDFDPSGIDSPLTAVQGLDGFVAKYNSNGQFIWVKQFGSIGSDIITALAIDDQDNNVIGVLFGGEIDLDPSTGSQDLATPVGGIDAAVVKLDTDGNYAWSFLVAPDVNNEFVSALAVNSIGVIALGAVINAITTGIPVQAMFAGVLDLDGAEIWSYDFQNQGQSNVISHIVFSEDEGGYRF